MVKVQQLWRRKRHWVVDKCDSRRRMRVWVMSAAGPCSDLVDELGQCGKGGIDVVQPLEDDGEVITQLLRVIHALPGQVGGTLDARLPTVAAWYGSVASDLSQPTLVTGGDGLVVIRTTAFSPAASCARDGGRVAIRPVALRR